MHETVPDVKWRHIVIALASVGGLWAIATYLFLPHLIARIYHRASLPSLNGLLRQPVIYPLAHYITKWNGIALLILFVLLIVLLTALWPATSSQAALLIGVLALTVAVRLPGVSGRAIWDDEAVSLLQVSGHPHPAWPRTPERAREATKLYLGTGTFAAIAEDLRQTDIHPPLYYWSLALWRWVMGFSIEAARGLSLLYSVGTVLALYMLLRVAQARRPLVPTVIYAVSTGAVFMGSIARNYALAMFLIVAAALCGYVAVDIMPRNRRRAAACAIAMSLFCGLAFHTHYLSLFPVAVIVGWFCLNSRRSSRALAIGAPLLTLLLGLVAAPALIRNQLHARPDQNAGFPGWGSELSMMLKGNLGVLWDPSYNNRLLNPIAIIGVPALIGIAVYLAAGRRREDDGKFWALLGGLAVAPSIGLLTLDVLFGKRSMYPLYLMFAGPPLVVILCHALVSLRSGWMRSAGVLIVATMFLLGINWGFEEGSVIPYQGGIRSLAQTVSRTRSASQIVVVDEGMGRTNPGAVIYELDPETLVVCFGRGTDFQKLWDNVSKYEDVWIARSFDTTPETVIVREELVRRFMESKAYCQVMRNDRVSHFRRLNAGGAADCFPPARS